MGYRREKVFICEICGREERARYLVCLPYGWTGSTAMCGACYCGDCTEGIKALAKRVVK